MRLLLSRAALAAALACGSATEPIGHPALAVYTFEVGDGLQQTVSLKPAAPSVGETMIVQSIVRNAGTNLIRINAKLCNLQFGGSLTVGDVGIECLSAAETRTWDMAIGDSAEVVVVLAVHSDRGQYTFTVQHLLEPSFVAAVPVIVR